MEEEREGLEEQLFVGTSVQVCEMPTPGDEYFFAFALNTPVANALYNVHPNVVVQMALRMRMLAAQHWSPHVLIQQAGATNGPLLLFCSVKRPRCPGQVRLASIALSGSSHWYTHVGNLTRQILLVHELAELRPMFQAPEHLDYLLAWPKTAAEEQED